MTQKYGVSTYYWGNGAKILAQCKVITDCQLEKGAVFGNYHKMKYACTVPVGLFHPVSEARASKIEKDWGENTSVIICWLCAYLHRKSKINYCQICEVNWWA